MRWDADNGVVVVSLIPYDAPIRVVFEPCPEIDFPCNGAVFEHELTEMFEIKVKQFRERHAVAHHETTAESPIDGVDHVVNTLAFFPASGIGNESRLPRK